MKNLVRAGLVLLAVVSSAAVTVRSVVGVVGVVGVAGAAVILAGDDEPTRPTRG